MSNTIVLKKHRQSKNQEKYHHGNLRQALVEAGIQILQFEGVDKLGLRSLARLLDVSQTAPYSHFKDKTELLAAIAEVGFQNLAIVMLETVNGSVDLETRIKSLAVGYVSFAVQNKALFSLMFGRELKDMKSFPTLSMTAGKSYAMFSSAVTDCMVDRSDVSARTATNAVWSLVHGLAVFGAEGKLVIKDNDIQSFVSEHLDGLLGTIIA